MTTKPLSNRPADPRLISFDRSCFVQDGETVHYTVERSHLVAGPARFDNEADAAAYARTVGRPYTTHIAPRMVRVSWTVAA